MEKTTSWSGQQHIFVFPTVDLSLGERFKTLTSSDLVSLTHPTLLSRLRVNVSAAAPQLKAKTPTWAGLKRVFGTSGNSVQQSWERSDSILANHRWPFSVGQLRSNRCITDMFGLNAKPFENVLFNKPQTYVTWISLVGLMGHWKCVFKEGLNKP